MSALVLVVVLSSVVHPIVASLADSTKPSRPLVAASWVHTRDVKRSLSDVMDDNLNHEHRKANEVRVDRLVDALRPIYTALPKNAKGRLEHSAVRYALHRHFVHKHGMYVKGLEPAGETWDSSSPADILEDKVPGYVQHMFEERLHGGLDLKETALLAATLEHFIHLENIERLQLAYNLSDVTVNDTLLSDQLDNVLDRYAFLQTWGTLDMDPANKVVVKAHFESVFTTANDIFPDWPETQSFWREVKDSVVEGARVVEGDVPISFETVGNIVEEGSRRYGRFQDGGCRSLAKELIANEDRGSGRVKLSDFYQAGWNFMENKEYLRTIGVLEETNGIARIIIPNYVLSKSNCMVATSLYMVCCIDQCEELLGQLERRIGAPGTTPEQIVALTAVLPSATIQAPRSLSVSLVKHLNEIADLHDGKVPLHGRLFAQWMHHAYPRECPFPVAAGTTKPMTPDDWLKETNISTVATGQEIRSIIQAQKNLMADQVKVKDLVDGDLEATLPWSEEEELVLHRPRPSLAHELGVVGKCFACVGAFSAVTFQLLQMTVGAKRHMSDGLFKM